MLLRSARENFHNSQAVETERLIISFDVAEDAEQLLLEMEQNAAGEKAKKHDRCA
jgi:hypothetical protein